MENLTVVVPYWNGDQTIGRLLDSLPPALPVVVVDDHSDKRLQLDRPNVTVIRPETKGWFTGASNAGIEACKTDVLVLNQDVVLRGTAWLDLLARHRKKYAMIGERIKGTHPAWPRGYIHGTFMFIRRDAWNRVGPMSVRDYPLWGSTCEWQVRAARRGYRILPLTEVPGMDHARKNERYGSSIKELLRRDPDHQKWYIRTPPAISVVMNCYNHGRFLEDAINSLIGGQTSLGIMPGQSFQSFEIIIVDDGSTDGTPEIGKALADPWKAIRYIRQENAGSAAACNTGINAAYGTYIAPLDSDDMMLDHRLEMMYRVQLAQPHSVVFDDLMTFANGEIHQNGHGGPKVWRMPTYDYQQIVWKNTMHKGLMYPKKAWEEVGGYPEIMNKGREDWAFNVGLGRLGWCGAKVNQAGYLYRREGHNRTLENTSPRWHKHFLEQLMSLYPDVYQGRYPMGCCGSGSSRRAGKGTSKVGGNKLMALAPGQQGMVKLQYNGRNMGDATFWGPVTNTRYIFGGIRKSGYVDARDVEKMTALFQGGRQLFVLAKEPVQKPKAKEFVPEPEPELVVDITPIHVPEPDPEPDPVHLSIPEDMTVEATNDFADPGDMTVAKIRGYVPLASKAELEHMLALEQEGENTRKTAVAALEEALASV